MHDNLRDLERDIVIKELPGLSRKDLRLSPQSYYPFLICYRCHTRRQAPLSTRLNSCRRWGHHDMEMTSQWQAKFAAKSIKKNVSKPGLDIKKKRTF